MSGMVELAALCVVIVVGVPLALCALWVACCVGYGTVIFAWQLLVALVYACGFPFMIAWLALKWLARQARKLAVYLYSRATA